MQYDRTVWSPDPNTFRPTRFHDPETAEADQAQRRHFLPWSRGPRQCPGMKIAQIEFVALMAMLFSQARVECARMDGETAEMARERTLGVVVDSQPLISMQIRRPRDVVLVWEKRA
jgi:cytochrome P450